MVRKAKVLVKSTPKPKLGKMLKYGIVKLGLNVMMIKLADLRQRKRGLHL
jgi:hypothetical protein